MTPSILHRPSRKNLEISQYRNNQSDNIIINIDTSTINAKPR